MKNKNIAIFLLFTYMLVWGHGLIHHHSDMAIIGSSSEIAEHHHLFEEFCSCPCHLSGGGKSQTGNSDNIPSTHHCWCCCFDSESYILSTNHIDISKLKQISAIALLFDVIQYEITFPLYKYNYTEEQNFIIDFFYPEIYSFRGPPVV